MMDWPTRKENCASALDEKVMWIRSRSTMRVDAMVAKALTQGGAFRRNVSLMDAMAGKSGVPVW